MSGGKRPLLFKVETPVPGFPTVSLYEDSWASHIEYGHPEMKGQQETVKSILADPTFVVVGNVHTLSNVLFLSEQHLDEEKAPFVVAVSKTELVVRSAYAKSQWKNFTPSKVKAEHVIWRKKP